MLTDYLLGFYVPLKNFSLKWRSHHCRWRAAKFRPMLGAQGIRAGGDLYRAPPAVTRDLSFPGSFEGPPPFSCLLRHTRGCRCNLDSYGFRSYFILSILIELQCTWVLVTLQFGPSVLFIVWSVSWTILHVVVLGLQPYFYRNYELDLKWFSYLTHWGYTTLAIFTLSDSIAAVYVHIRRRDIIKGGKWVPCLTHLSDGTMYTTSI
jgi:hypothetical protein